MSWSPSEPPTPVTPTRVKPQTQVNPHLAQPLIPVTHWEQTTNLRNVGQGQITVPSRLHHGQPQILYYVADQVSNQSAL